MEKTQIYPVANAPSVGPNGEHIVRKEGEISRLTAWEIVCALNKYVTNYADFKKLLHGAAPR